MPKPTHTPTSRHIAKHRVPSGDRWRIVVVIAAHLNMAILEMVLRSCDVFYLSWKNEFDTSSKATAAVQSIATSFSCFSGLIGGLMAKRYGCRFTGIIGGLLTCIGVFGSVWVQNIFQLYATAAVAGVGVGIAFNSGLTAVAMHFKKGYKTANAIAYAGCGTGSIVWPLLIQHLLEGYGWRGAFLILSAAVANVFAFVALFRNPLHLKRSKPASTKPDDQLQCAECDDDIDDDMKYEENAASATLHDGSNALPLDETDKLRVAEREHCIGVNERDPNGYVSPRDTSNKSCALIILLKRLAHSTGLSVCMRSYCFTLLCLIQIESSIPYYGAIIFIIPRARSVGVAPTSSAILLSIFGIGSALGRLGNGLLISWRISAETVCAVCVTVAGLSLLIINVDDYVVLAVASFLLGLATGISYAVNVVLTRQFVGLKMFPVGIGFYYGFIGRPIGGLIGPVVVGWLFDITRNYKTVFYALAGTYFVCALQMLLFPLLKRLEPGIDINHFDE